MPDQPAKIPAALLANLAEVWAFLVADPEHERTATLEISAHPNRVTWAFDLKLGRGLAGINVRDSL